MILALTVPAWAGEQTILITSNDASGVYYTSKGGVKMEMSGGMNNEGFMVQRHYDQINFRSFNFKIKKIVFRCLDNSVEGDNNSFYWGPTTMYIAANTSVNNVVAGTLTTPYNNSTYMAKWESSPTYPDGLPIGQQLTIKCQGHPVRFAYIEITIDKEDGDMYELVTRSDQIVTGDKTYMLVHRRQSGDTQGDALSSNQENESTSGNFESTKVDLFNNGFLARATGDVMFLRFSTGGSSNYPYRIIAGGAYLRTESADESSPTDFATKRLTRVANPPSNTGYVNTSLAINSSTTGGTNGFDWYAMLTYEATTGYRIRHYNGKMQFRNITSNSTQNTNLALQRVFLYKPAQKYEVFTATDGHGTITLRDGIVVDGSHNYSQMMDNVSFIVAPLEGYKIKKVTITNLTDDTEITPTVTTTTLGQTYAFSMPGSDVRINAEFEAVQYHNITMEIKPSSRCGNIFLTEGYIVQGDNVMSYDGQNVVFNVSSNPIDITSNPNNPELWEYYEFISVTVTDDVTGESITYNLSDGNYSFIMPDHDVTITANFRAALMISTACEPSNGGYFEQSTMTCNGQSTNFYNGAQYYADDVMTFMVKTNYGYKINKVIVTDNFGTETTLTPTETYADGNFYSFSMPNSNVTITAYFYEAEDDLYLIGQANGGDWAPNVGQKFNYDVDNSRYYLKVYFKGSGEYGGDPNNAFSEFNLTKKLANRPGSEGGWDDIANDRLGYISYTDGGEPISDGEHKSLASGYNYKENKFKIPAGIYTIYVNRAKTDIWVQLEEVSLTFDPADGTADNPEVVSSGTTVNIAGDICSQIKAINPDEPDANFKYKYDRSINGTSYTGDATIVSAGASTTANLDVVNEGETVTELKGWNYLGWIVAENTGYYKVIETPLSWIEEHGEEGKTYTVSDQLQGVYRFGASLWCKDLGDKSIVKTHPEQGQEDFMKTHYFNTTDNVFENVLGRNDWDQSNWIELDFSDYTNGAQLAMQGEKKLITKGTVTGKLTNKLNYKMKVTSGQLDINGDLPYEPNIYCTVNFLPDNLTLNGEAENYPVSETVNDYYFLNPKVQEYAYVTWAQWDRANSKFVIPAGLNNDLDGAFYIGGWDYNIKEGNLVMDALDADGNQGKLYNFHFIVRRTTDAYGAKKTLSFREDAPSIIEAWPIDLTENSYITAITTVDTEAQVVGVEYVNLAGMRSGKPWQGVNIVVTRYSDGTRTTTKVVK